MDIIQEFSDILGMHTDIPEAFRIAGGYFVNSVTLGRFYKLEDMHNYRPNIFVLLASPPKITRRGELIKGIKTVIFNAFKTYHNLLKDDKDLDANKAHMFDGGSPEIALL